MFKEILNLSGEIIILLVLLTVIVFGIIGLVKILAAQIFPLRIIPERDFYNFFIDVRVNTCCNIIEKWVTDMKQRQYRTKIVRCAAKS